MCLYTKQIKVSSKVANSKTLDEFLFHKFAKVATKDIKVFKILKSNHKSLYRNMDYTPNTHYYQTGIKFTYTILRTYNPLKKTYNIFYMQIDRGLHSYSTIEDIKQNIGIDNIITIMYIPKGSVYFKSRTEIVSDNLIWYGEII